MNAAQAVWIEQVRSDHAVLQQLRRMGARPCHQLHYLQMVTEKLGKAYFWRAGTSPRKSHASFVKFLGALNDRPEVDRRRIARLFEFRRAQDFENWILNAAPIAYQLERLAPALAGDEGPNAEYPWPRRAPVQCPANYDFVVWKLLSETGRGRHLLKVIDTAVNEFAKFA